mmetsp:Transcript_23052/g.46640  ORF Transcript_23052/g.46640 Transcript_23052/m.46640 type:complete len:279 (+) Transcript_23052:83-919(+)|eukprot:CAMPEP_0181315082 /NCGR_PEP_ID=MMETSP1101-20121128/15174_1 /TAXON_ID=46948 /ORGANISM="Rhodomonas abbreviata, Strain Caron Lab Isolate" /LENGTH=278 /DNA_ID=CAMNT_0023422243 /DNA_START=83 /DNA_END=919 /DNA_ORIENTATION=+
MQHDTADNNSLLSSEHGKEARRKPCHAGRFEELDHTELSSTRLDEFRDPIAAGRDVGGYLTSSSPPESKKGSVPEVSFSIAVPVSCSPEITEDFVLLKSSHSSSGRASLSSSFEGCENPRETAVPSIISPVRTSPRRRRLSREDPSSDVSFFFPGDAGDLIPDVNFSQHSVSNYEAASGNYRLCSEFAPSLPPPEEVEFRGARRAASCCPSSLSNASRSERTIAEVRSASTPAGGTSTTSKLQSSLVTAGKVDLVKFDLPPNVNVRHAYNRRQGFVLS